MESDSKIDELCKKLASELITNQDREDFGTTIDETLTQDYEKTLKKNFEKLKKEFDTIDFNQDEEITINELIDFFKKKDPSMSEEEIHKIFKLFDKNENDKITIDEFIYRYIKLEEQLKIKYSKLRKVKDDLKTAKKDYESKKKKFENEKKNGEISENSEVLIQLIEGINLKSPISNLVKAKVEFEQISNESIVNKNVSRLIESNNPRFNEDFHFQIFTPQDIINLKVIDQSYADALLGTIKLDLKKYADQIKKEETLDVSPLDDPNTKNGQLHFRIRYRYDNYLYFSNLVQKTDIQIDRLKEVLSELKEYLEKIKEPFGLIIAHKAQKIIENKIMDKSEDPKQYIESWRRSVYGRPGMLGQSIRFSENPFPQQKNNQPNLRNSSNTPTSNIIDNYNKFNNFNPLDSGRESNNNIDSTNRGKPLLSKIDEIPEHNISQNIDDRNLEGTNIIKNENVQKEFKYDNINKPLILIGLGLCFLNCFGRNDYLNIATFLIGFLSLIGIEKQIPSNEYFYYCIIGSSVFDLIWLFSGTNPDVSSFLNGLSTFFTLVNLLNKCILGYFYLQKKENK